MPSRQGGRGARGKGTRKAPAKAGRDGAAGKLEESVYRYLFEESPSAAIIINLDGTVSELNRSMLATTGYSREEYLGRSALDFVVPAQREKVAALLARIAEREWTPATEIGVYARDGSIRTLLFSPGHAFIYEGKTPVAILLTAVDITEREKTARRLLDAARMEALVGLAGSIAHDFNNLLTVVLNYTRIALQDERIASSSREMLEEVIGAAERAEALTKQLHMFSREQSPGEDIVDINAIVRKMAPSLGKKAGEGVSFNLKLSRGLPVLRLNAGLIANVVENLADNAREAMPAGGTVTIATSRFEGRPPGAGETGSYIALSVGDEGEGIDESVRDRIFEPYFTLRRGRKARGLGLSIVYGAVRQFRGGISVESAVGKGTTVTIYLPVKD
jgi:PAS domain S-box-containing protein